jgi:hypothetical protein
VDEALATAKTADIVTVMPRIEQTEAGPVLRIPAEADYDVTDARLDAHPSPFNRRL